MYPLIKVAKIRKAVRFFTRGLTTSTKKTINLCLDLIRFGMGCTLISFHGWYYEYHGGDNKEQYLAIDGYELEFLSNLVVSYLFDKSKELLNQTTYHGIYHNEGLVMFKGKKSVQEIKYWLEEFQHIVYKAAVNQQLQFAAEIWTNDTNLPHSSKKDKVQTVANEKFPFLDMKMSCSPEGGAAILNPQEEGAVIQVCR